MNKQNLFTALLLILILFSAFVSPVTVDETQWVKTELYFGLQRNDSGIVAHEEWQAFADTVIAAYFPNGSTILNSDGRWKNEDGTVISEKSKLVILINEMTPEIYLQIDSVREKYKRYHHQTAVLRVDTKAEVKF